MKKDVLFVIPNLGAGGAEKSLINLLNSYDFDSYNVDLLLTHKSGIFLELLPPEVNVLDIPKHYKLFSAQFFLSIWGFFRMGKMDLLWYKILFTIHNRTSKDRVRSEQEAWKYLKHFFIGIDKKYDIAIGYLEKTANYIVVDCIDAKKKIGYIHNDYMAMGMDENIDHYFFNRLDHIVTVSEECVVALKNTFPNFKEKVQLIRNFIPKQYLLKLAEEFTPEVLNRNFILTIGRLTEQKAIDKAIDALEILQNDYKELEWFVLGEGHLRPELAKRIKEKNLENRFHLLGNTVNPYPFIKHSTMYVQTSIFEGKSMAIDEAKLFNKPIVVTNYRSAKDQICDNVNGLLTEMQPEQIAEKVKLMMEDSALRNFLSDNLKRESFCDEREIEKLYQLMQS